MRVLHICYSDKNGGAAIGAYRLHLAMRARGVNSEMFVIQKQSSDISIKPLLGPDTTAVYAASLAAAQEIRDLYGSDLAAIRSINIAGLDVAERINAHPAEIVQLHWIANNTLKLSDLPKIRKPVVWKMPDMWPFSGGEHYIRHGDPERHVEGYDKIGPFNAEEVDVDRFIWEAKRRHYKDLPLTITSPSRFLAKEAHRSILLGAYDAHVIPNPLPWQFLTGRPPNEAERMELRRTLGLPEDKMIVLFSAFSSKERRKGFHHIEDMVANHIGAVASPDELAFMVCGAAEPGVERIANYEVRKFAATDDVGLYKKYLRAADLLLFPSEMDSTAMVVQEALSQGLPSIVFDVGGLPEMVVHERNGFLVEPYDAAGLARGIAWWIRCEDKEGAAKFAVERARAMHNPATTVERYLKVYDEAVSRYRRGENFKSGRFFPEPADVRAETDAPRVAIIDPSAVDASDSSHHCEHVAAFAAAFAASGAQPILAVNAAAALESPFGPIVKALSWTAYDKIRIDRDRRDGPPIDADAIKIFDVNSEKSVEVYEMLARLAGELRFTRRDAILFPTTDRFCIEGALAFVFGHQDFDAPAIHFNIMFEKAEFLLGQYPLEGIMRAVKSSSYAGQKLFFYAETKQMADDLAARFDIPFRVLPPPGVFADAQLSDIAQRPAGAAAGRDAVRSAYAKARAMLERDGDAAAFVPPRGKRVIASLGRGRRDKGWAALPDIIEAFNKLPAANSSVFVIQRPRKMDALDEEEARLEAMSNVLLLDEIIPQSLLDSVCRQADVFLLPYDIGVYRNRGSAFGWRAVLNAKPLVVTAGTALCDTLLGNEHGEILATPSRFARLSAYLRRSQNPKPEQYLNGKTATGAEGFASALSGVLAHQFAFNAGAERMQARYFASIVSKNPVLAAQRENNFADERHIIVLREANRSAPAPQASTAGFRVDLVYGGEPDQAWIAAADGPAVLSAAISLRDGAVFREGMPAFALAALEARRVDRIYAPRDFAIAQGGLRNFSREWLFLVELYG